LLEVAQSGRTSDGHWYELYRGLLKSVDIKFNEGKLEVDLHPREDRVNKLVRVWTQLKERGTLESR